METLAAQVILGIMAAGLCLLLAGAGLAICWAVALPLRRQERARLFIDLLETGLQQGRTVEQTVRDISGTRDAAPGVRFHLLASHLEGGLPFDAALRATRGFLPPQIVAMLKVGGELGDLRKVLPACRGLLDDAGSKVRSAFDYLILMWLLVWVPVLGLALVTVRMFVWPNFVGIFESFGDGMAVPMTSAAILQWAWLVVLPQLGLAAGLYLAVPFYVGGPRFSSWLQSGFLPVTDWLALLAPWKRKRMQRDFFRMLALLLDANVPEERAVCLAGEATANQVFIRRAARAAGDLRSGAKLPAALQQMDDTGEFRWRLENAVYSGGFLAALTGWLDALDAWAFREEQTASQALSTGVVLLNGTVVGLVAASFFHVLTHIVHEVALW